MDAQELKIEENCKFLNCCEAVIKAVKDGHEQPQIKCPHINKRWIVGYELHAQDAKDCVYPYVGRSTRINTRYCEHIKQPTLASCLVTKAKHGFLMKQHEKQWHVGTKESFQTFCGQVEQKLMNECIAKYGKILNKRNATEDISLKQMVFAKPHKITPEMKKQLVSAYHKTYYARPDIKSKRKLQLDERKAKRTPEEQKEFKQRDAKRKREERKKKKEEQQKNKKRRVSEEREIEAKREKTIYELANLFDDEKAHTLDSVVPKDFGKETYEQYMFPYRNKTIMRNDEPENTRKIEQTEMAISPIVYWPDEILYAGRGVLFGKTFGYGQMNEWRETKDGKEKNPNYSWKDIIEIRKKSPPENGYKRMMNYEKDPKRRVELQKIYKLHRWIDSFYDYDEGPEDY